MVDLAPNPATAEAAPTSPIASSTVKPSATSTSPVARRRQSSGSIASSATRPAFTSHVTPEPRQFNAVHPPWSITSSRGAPSPSPTLDQHSQSRPSPWRSTSSTLPTPPVPVTPDGTVEDSAINEEEAFPPLSPPPVSRRRESTGGSPEAPMMRRRRESSSRIKSAHDERPEATIRGYYFHSLVRHLTAFNRRNRTFTEEDDG